MLSLALITGEINRRSKIHLIGHLQEFRKDVKGLARLPSRDIFTPQTTFERYAFHAGGRKELQFNVGYEGHGKDRCFRHGVAFSFVKGQSLLDPSTLFPKLSRFNKFLTVNPEAFADLKMWEWIEEFGERKRTKNKPAAPIKWNRDAFLAHSPFIFLGRLRPADEIDYELILSDFDRLLPLYEFVERASDSVKDEERFDAVGGFKFEPHEIDKVTKTAATITAQQVKVELRENKLQSALRDHLKSRFGAKNVSQEQRISTMRGYLYKTDIMVRHGKDYWLYEAKIGSTARQCIRRALGQLLEYSFWPGHQEATKLIVVGESPLTAKSGQYVSRLRIKFSLPIEYQQFDIKKAALIKAKY